MYVYIYIYIYIYTIILHFTSTLVGANEGPQRERERGGGRRAQPVPDQVPLRQVGSANGTTQVVALAQSCVQAVHDSGS